MPPKGFQSILSALEPKIRVFHRNLMGNGDGVDCTGLANESDVTVSDPFHEHATFISHSHLSRQASPIIPLSVLDNTRRISSLVTTASQAVQYRINGRFAVRPAQTPESVPAEPENSMSDITNTTPASTPAPGPTPGGGTNPTNGTPPAPPTAEQMAAAVTQLQSQMGVLMAALSATQAVQNTATTGAPPAAGVATVAQPVSPPPLVVQQQYTPPLVPHNSPTGASPSLQSLFPDVKPACITSVITHDLEAADLYKLDVRVRDSEPTYSLTATGTFEMNMTRHKAYKNLNSVLLPLNTFFAILTAHLPTRSAATVYFYRYANHLATLAAEYEWPAVLEYHTLSSTGAVARCWPVPTMGGGLGCRASQPLRVCASQTDPGCGEIAEENHGRPINLIQRTVPQIQCWHVRLSMRVETSTHLLCPGLWEGPPPHAARIGRRPDV
ncbi:hypothetical protein FB45DRAFT_1125566 [Roridomyces roridus]|uniref:Uncharacterized protein n=1 Tax=Roridomyces roridus TaxID=1738132 RepID=A0AAD7C7V2_9AGAR|nr:hypothetical protein FB45DRAFT_1125566 [Roridomyces roridus]